MDRIFVKPGHLYADSQLKYIAKKLCPLTWPFRYCKQLDQNTSQLTYGYTGVVARTIIDSLSQHDKVLSLSKLHILDHPFVPPHLMRSCYRVTCVQPSRLHTLEFDTSSKLPTAVRHTIYEYLKSIQSSNELSITGIPPSQIDTAKRLSLHILESPSLLQLDNLLRQTGSSSISIQPFSLPSNIVSVFKPRSATFGLEGNAIYSYTHAYPLNYRASDIEFAYCPTSLLACRLILLGIPTRISPIHPLSFFLPQHTPSLRSQNSLGLIYDAICRSTIHLSSLRHQFLS